MLNPKCISTLKKSPVVSPINPFSIIATELVKINWNTCPPVSISTPRDKGLNVSVLRKSFNGGTT